MIENYLQRVLSLSTTTTAKKMNKKQQINIKRLKTYEEKETENYGREDGKKHSTHHNEAKKMKWIDTDKHSVPAF